MSRAQLTSTDQQNSGGPVSPYVAGKNKIINGDFGIWQRGTSFTLTTATATYCADRFLATAYGTGTAATLTQQTFTPGTAPVSGYEGSYFPRITNFSTGTIAYEFRQRIEDVRTFAGQTATFSFWSKASVAQSGLTVRFTQNFGSGGSTAVSTDASSTLSITTGWVRNSFTVAIPSISGKTVGTSSYLEVLFFLGSGGTASSTIDTWGWQVEAGSVATPFTTATGTFSGELAACQRYYYQTSNAGTVWLANGWASGTTNFDGYFQFPTTMRTAASVTATSGASYFYIAVGSTSFTTTTPTGFFNPSVQGFYLRFAGSGLTTGQGGISQAQSSSAVIMASAEL